MKESQRKWAKKLKSKICTSAIDAGYSLYSNGSISTKDYHYDNRQLKCTHGRIFSAQRKKMIDHCIENNAYRKNYITNDKNLVIVKTGKISLAKGQVFDLVTIVVCAPLSWSSVLMNQASSYQEIKLSSITKDIRL